MPLGAINVGLRQRGRYCGANVIFCDADPASIASAVDQVESAGFREVVLGIKNPYGDGRSCDRAYRFLKDTDFAAMRTKVEDPLEIQERISRGDDGKASLDQPKV